MIKEKKNQKKMPTPGDPVLVVRKPYIDMILRGEKTLEIRGCRCLKDIGTRIYLSASGSGAICGSVIFEGCLGPMTLKDWDEYRAMHRVDHREPMYKKTYGWRFATAEVIYPPIPYVVKRGTISWRYYEPVGEVA